MDQIAWLEQSAFATWLRESSWALFALLILHTLTMGAIVGLALASCARLFGLASTVSLPAFGRLTPILGWALLAAAVSGLLLVAAYPAKALTNPLFYVKLAMATSAAAIAWNLQRRVFTADVASAPSWAPKLAALGAGLWIATLAAGKFLAYTHKMLLVG
ncbi:MAG: hypothetical protein JNK30_04465 [Phenylobacterium sp.]|uniref:hypothetical protein n=1 Tax=Phenylobacterium sp. TaxID=1871053 RepID=UPI001A5097FD|nr:hypothetical protein [Phenylobacterium sp.]MBL8770614.1 hypothetical protein [Phenylobacterium sp.]